MIRKVQPTDAKQICELYNYYITYTTITFEEETVTEEEIKSRIHRVTSKFPWFVYEENKEIAGYAYLSEWRTRASYRYAAESTVYLNQKYMGKGIGSSLYRQLIEDSKNLSLHCLIGGIALPNNASIALHEKLNFRKVAHFQQVGFKFNQWIDVGYWQLLLKPVSF
jgi:phosphinothricin acetyltransferase